MTKDRNPRELPDRLCLSGRWFTRAELEEIRETCEALSGLSRNELTLTLCEHYDWRRPNGALKREACAKALEKLSALGYVNATPPRKIRVGRPRPPSASLAAAGDPIVGTVASLRPVRVEPVRSHAEWERWKALLDRWHYLGYRRGFGARLYYFIWSDRVPGQPLGCLMYASSAWKVGCRDRWIGWTQDERRRRLHLIVNQSRFLLFPWVEAPNLASHVQSVSLARLRDDWRRRYEYEPVLAEAFVDAERFTGACYRAANTGSYSYRRRQS